LTYAGKMDTVTWTMNKQTKQFYNKHDFLVWKDSFLICPQMTAGQNIKDLSANNRTTKRK